MTYDLSGKLNAGHNIALAERRNPLNIDPRTGDYLIGNKGRTPSFNTLRLLAIGSLYAVNNCRDRLHQLGYAHPSEWSQPLPMTNPNGVLRGLTPTDVMRILTKRISLPQRSD